MVTRWEGESEKDENLWVPDISIDHGLSILPFKNIFILSCQFILNSVIDYLISI